MRTNAAFLLTETCGITFCTKFYGDQSRILTPNRRVVDSPPHEHDDKRERANGVRFAGDDCSSVLYSIDLIGQSTCNQQSTTTVMMTNANGRTESALRVTIVQVYFILST